MSAQAKAKYRGFSLKSYGSMGKLSRMDQWADKYYEERDKLVDNLKSVASAAEDLVKVVANASVDELAAGRTKLQGKLSDAREMLGEMPGALMEKTRYAATTTNKYVRNNPGKTLAVAAVVAAVIVGFLWTRR